jgi:hypothetical protein
MKKLIQSMQEAQGIGLKESRVDLPIFGVIISVHP